MKLTDVTCKPMTLTVIKSKKNGDTYFKLTGLIPVKENQYPLLHLPVSLYQKR